MDLFEKPGQGEGQAAVEDQQAGFASAERPVPLADRMRPQSFAEFLGQEELAGPAGPIRQMLETGAVPSMIFWGPPGSGKTTLARLVAHETRTDFIGFSAVTSGVKEIKAVVERARYNRQAHGRGTILFVDEIHRFNKAQQDAFLPHVEDGTIVLIGATTENPSFEVNSALLSRCRVYRLVPLAQEDLWAILRTALGDHERGLGKLRVDIAPAVIEQIATFADGDARVALNLLELATLCTKPGPDGTRRITKETVERAAQKKTLLYDKEGEEHYNIISAFHKSLRGSDPQAALYWLARMLEAGEDPLYVARRMVRFASEDVGNADPQALTIAIAAKQAVEFVGMPEANLALAQAAVYLATAPKSNSLYVAYHEVLKDLAETQNQPVPLHLRNPVTSLMTEQGYGKGYLYAHEFPGHFVPQDYLPDNLKGRQYYKPSDQGFEKQIDARMQAWGQLKKSQPKDAGRDPKTEPRP